jgi:hypothetical protein
VTGHGLLRQRVLETTNVVNGSLDMRLLVLRCLVSQEDKGFVRQQPAARRTGKMHMATEFLFGFYDLNCSHSSCSYEQCNRTHPRV